MAELLQLVNTVMILLIKPLSLVKFTCFFGVRTICIVIQTWTELLRAAMGFHARLLWKLTIWAIAVLSLPIRSLTALQRERAVRVIFEKCIVCVLFNALVFKMFFPHALYVVLIFCLF